MGIGSFLLGAFLGSTHTVEKHTKYEVKHECPFTRKAIFEQPIKVKIKMIELPRFRTKEDIEEYFIGKPINEETMAELKAVLEEFDRRNYD